MKYKHESELFDVLRRFESCTIGRDEWGHPEHLIVAFLYSRENSLDAAYERMKTGIFRLLESFGVDLAKEMPYHETLTVFWITAVHRFAVLKSNSEPLSACIEMFELFGKNYPGEFYSHETLFSDEARAVFVPPDRAPSDKRDRHLLSGLAPLEPMHAEKQV